MTFLKDKRTIILVIAAVIVLLLLILRVTGVFGQPIPDQKPKLMATSTLQIVPEEARHSTGGTADIKQRFSNETFATTTYITVTDGCGPHFEGDCLNVRAAPSTEAEVVDRLRNGQVLEVSRIFEKEAKWWYQVVFNEWLRYPERVEGDWYVAANYVEQVNRSALEEPKQNPEFEKHIVVDLSEQKLYAYEGEDVFMEIEISTGLVGTLTPRGTFSVFHRTPSRYMQGPLPGISDDEYDLPGVPWNLYFTQQGAVIHGAYWHDNFGMNWSHGCVNLPPEKAKQLYRWTPINTKVTVQD